MNCRIAAFVLCVFCCAAPAFAQDEPVNLGPPPGIVHSTATLAGVLSKHDSAVGVRDAGVADTRIEQWTYSADGLEGTREVVQSGEDERQSETLGPFHFSNGKNGTLWWQQNVNGITISLQRIHNLDEISRAALKHAKQNVKWVRLIGESLKPAAFVVEVNPPGGRHEWLFYDKSTYLIVRRELIYSGRRLTDTFDDFRKTNGLTEAWHVHSSDGRAFNDEDLKMQSLQIGPAIDRTKFAAPPSRATVDALGADRVALPAQIVDDEVLLPLTINGHVETFVLDSGASSMVLDKDIATEIGLKNLGRSTGETAGTYVATKANVPSISIGQVQMHDIVVETLPFREFVGEKTRVVGLLGFDFIASTVVHIDYLHRTADVFDPVKFSAPANAIVIPIALDDQVPTVTATINQAVGKHFIVDTGAFRSTIFSTFQQQHTDTVTDQGLGEAIEASFPFIDRFYGVGGRVAFRPMQVKNFGFAGVTFPQWLFMVTQNAKAFEADDEDGLIGQDFLRNFEVYLDYPHSRIWLVPNERFKARWPGMLP